MIVLSISPTSISYLAKIGPSFDNKCPDTYWQTYFYVVRTFLKNFLRVLRTQKNTTLMLVGTETCTNGSITLRSWFLKPFFPLL